MIGDSSECQAGSRVQFATRRDDNDDDGESTRSRSEPASERERERERESGCCTLRFSSREINLDNLERKKGPSASRKTEPFSYLRRMMLL